MRTVLRNFRRAEWTGQSWTIGDATPFNAFQYEGAFGIPACLSPRAKKGDPLPLSHEDALTIVNRWNAQICTGPQPHTGAPPYFYILDGVR